MARSIIRIASTARARPSAGLGLKLALALALAALLARILAASGIVPLPG